MNSMEYAPVTDEINVPKNAGVEGFILAIRRILKLPRVASFSVDSRGKITYTRYARPEEPSKSIEVDFDTVSPSAIVRNTSVHEVDVEEMHNNAAVVFAHLFNRASHDHLFPVAFIGGAKSYLGPWHTKTTGVPLPSDSAYGFPFLRDRHIPDEVLLFALGYARDSALIDAQVVYKILIPSLDPPPRIVEIEAM